MNSSFVSLGVRFDDAASHALKAVGAEPTDEDEAEKTVRAEMQKTAGELAVMVDRSEVDRIFLARVAPTKFRFEVHNEASGDRNLDTWMTGLGAAFVINGSYYARNGTPATPVLSAGTPLGPAGWT